MKSRYNLLFVCLGNICRSPAGENIFRHVVKESGLSDQIDCDSSGTIGIHSGNKPDARMSQTISRRGYEVAGHARQFALQDFELFDLILTMDNENFQNVIKLAVTAEERAKVRNFTDFCSQHDLIEVPDPYYGGNAGFELVADLIEDGVEGLLAHVKKEIEVS
ncbi:MAG: low molecular weight protein-tyrosine-phosphatase [Akkermansiaceae bacterium]|jgi:protein-tyrosine phosphatase